MNNERIYDLLNKISEDISELKITSAKQEENIKEHIRRTELAEENIQLIREEIKPLKEHVVAINGTLKIIGILSIVFGCITAIIELGIKFIGIFK